MSERMTLRIYGQVQGVNFRYLTCEYARTLGLCGYVKNELDRSVTVVAEGEKNICRNFYTSVIMESDTPRLKI